MIHRRIRNGMSCLVAALLLALPAGVRAALYQVGDVVEDFSLRDRATGNSVRLADLAGKIVVLDWFAWWCPFCQAAAPQLLSGVHDYYATRNGNPGGIPVLHVGVNLQSAQEAQTQNFVTRAGYNFVLEDFGRSVASRIASGGQPIFAIINGVTNSPSHKPWELIYSRAGYGQTTFPVAEFRHAIDAVLPQPLPLPAPTLSEPRRNPDGSFAFRLRGTAGRSYRIEMSGDLREWTPLRTLTLAAESEAVTVEGGSDIGARFVRVAAL